MLDKPSQPVRQGYLPSYDNRDSPPDIDLGSLTRGLLSALRRQSFVILATALLATVLAGLYVLTATPLYTATSRIIIDPRANTSPDGSSNAPVLLLADALLVDSEVEVIRSRELADRVIGASGLLETDAISTTPSAISSVLAGFRELFEDLVDREVLEPDPVAAGSEIAIDGKQERARRWLGQALTVERSGTTYVIEILVTTKSPQLSARIANTVVDQYFVLQADAAFENTRRLGDWLRERVNVLEASVSQADQLIEAYKRDNDLYSVRGDQLPSSAEFAAANDRLIQTRSAIVDLNATISQLAEIIASNSTDASIDAAYRTPTLNELQSRYADLRGRALDLSARIGANHQLTRRARSDAEATSALIVDEYRKILASLTNRSGILADQTERTLSRLDELREESAQDAQKIIKLNELEREAKSKRTLYESMLAKMDASVQAESFTSAPARVIARAVPPDRKSSPRSKVVVALGLFGGLLLGGGLAFMREQLDDVFRLASSVPDELGVPLLGIIPRFADDRRLATSAERRSQPVKIESSTSNGMFGKRKAHAFAFVADYPGSLFAETMRSVGFAIDPRGPRNSHGDPQLPRAGHVLAVASASPGEGKSTIAANLATFQSVQNSKVALIDFDIRTPSLTRLLRDDAPQNSLSQLLADPSGVRNTAPNALLRGAHFIRNDLTGHDFTFGDRRSLQAFENLLEALRSEFQIIIIDLPPMTNMMDARAVSNYVDSTLLVIEWGRIQRWMVKQVLAANHTIQDKLVGAVYSKVRTARYSKYNRIRSESFYYY